MKSQNDMIISIVAVVLALIVAGILMATQPEPAAQVPVTPVVTTMAKAPEGTVVMANALPNAGQGVPTGGGGGGAMKGGAAGSRGMAPGDSNSSVGKKGMGSQFLKAAS